MKQSVVVNLWGVGVPGMVMVEKRVSLRIILGWTEDRYPRSNRVTDTRIYRWDELPFEKVTEMVSRKVVTGNRQTMVQVYLKRGAHVPLHSHDSEQMVYVLQGIVKWVVGGREMLVREGEVLYVPSCVRHQAEALEDTFQLAVLSDKESRVTRQGLEKHQ